MMMVGCPGAIRKHRQGRSLRAAQYLACHVSFDDDDDKKKNSCFLLWPSPSYNADETCITYESVNVAFNSAKSKLRLPHTKSKMLTERDIDQLAKVIVETTRILALQ